MKHYLQLHLFKAINNYVSFHVHEDSQHGLLADCCAWNYFFTGESACFHSIICLFDTPANPGCGKSKFNPYVNIF